ncbi:MAG: hypothetical protein IJS36_01255 [Kiritimatiellae bacterium]|nr:hypothetical protein [Kiritimatiellia bacterium]
MSRTYRYDPDSDPECEKDLWEADGKPDEETKCFSSARSAVRHGEYDFRLASAPSVMTVEWALMKMQPRVNWVTEGLVRDKIIPPHEREDMISKLNVVVAQAFPYYSPSRKSGDGRRASVATYLRRAIDNAVNDEIKARYRYKRAGVNAQMAPGSDGAGESPDALGLDEVNAFHNWLKVRSQVELKMDMETIRADMDSDIDRRCFDLKLAGFTFEEIAREISQMLEANVTRHYVEKGVMSRIRKLLAAYGYGPHGAER